MGFRPRHFLGRSARSPARVFREAAKFHVAYHVPPGTSERLHHLFSAGGWPAVQLALAQSPDLWPLKDISFRGAALRRLVLAEIAVFWLYRFDIGWCDYARHWYVRGDVRQKDCPPHTKAGEMWRWRHPKTPSEGDSGEHRRM